MLRLVGFLHGIDISSGGPSDETGKGCHQTDGKSGGRFWRFRLKADSGMSAICRRKKQASEQRTDANESEER